ncbi:MAG TPA: protein-tyrosine-phosphatase [Ohtaekwangia sp.]|uniref:protein-tyrosine-phosphatase n=1 Tax=Ohtaekwangia sp. TaxID=2066019 RepID=UPI002F95C917
MSTEKNVTLLPALQFTVNELTREFHEIPPERKEILKELTQFIQKNVENKQPVYLNFICTHNSRRSHLSQLWAQAAAYYYSVPNVSCFSGGTEATAFNPRAVKAMQEAGFAIVKSAEDTNPIYNVKYTLEAPGIKAFSKKYDDPFNHNKDFAAVMTCSHADENCPLVLGATARIALTYDDPKNFDDTPQESAKYTERVRQIGREILYAFSQVKV